MKEENQNVSKNSWKRIFGKKWFFPATYLVVAALLLTGVLWYQNLGNQVPEVSEDPNTDISGDSITNPNDDLLGYDEESEPVMEEQEVVQMPVAEENQAEIVTKFYDYAADSEDQVNALVQYNNKYYQSQGVDIAFSDGEAFDVTASLSGTVTEVKEDPLLGQVVKIQHANDISTYYASLDNILVEQGAEVKQGDTIASAGRNLIGQANGTHVHFELRKNGESVDPEEFFNRPLSEIGAGDNDKEENEEESTESNGEEGNTEEESTEGNGEEENTEEESSTGVDEEDGNTEEDEEAGSENGSENEEESSDMDSSAAMANA